MPQLSLHNRVLAAVGILGFVGAIVAFDLGCPGSSTDENTASTDVASVEVTPSSATEELGDSYCFQAIVKDGHGVELSGKTVTWSSSQPQVAHLGDGSTGCAQALAVGGPVTITATSEGKKGTASFTAIAIAVNSVTVAPDGQSIAVGATLTLTATVRDHNSNV